MAWQKKRHTGQKQRQTAAAAYASAQGGREDDCITSEEMASLVEGAVDHRRRAMLLDHIGWCSSCYDEWLALRGEMLQQEKAAPARALLRLLSSGRGLAYAGSALSVAAAVVIFLNLDFRQHTTGAAEDEAMEVLRSDRPAVKAPPAAAPPQAAQEAEYAGTEAADAVKMSGRDTSAALLEQKEEDGASRLQGLNREEVQQAPPGEPAADGRTLPGAAAAALYEQIQQGCSRGVQDTAFWQRLHAELAASQKGAAHGEKGRDSKLAGLIAQLAATGDAERLCPQVVILLRD